MADKIKAFFEKRKGGKFKGKGHKLTETAKPKPVKEEKPIVRRDPTEDAKQAGVAALARFEKKGTIVPKSFSQLNSLASSKSSKSDVGSSNSRVEAPPVEKVNSNPEILAVQGVYFKCPMISPEVLPKDEWKEQIRNFLYEQVEMEKGLTSCLMIHTLNKNRDEVSQCVDTLCTYLNNIVQHPDEEKYRKIRLSNKVFQDKVAKIEGSMQFLEAAGFEKKRLPFKEEEDDFLVFAEDNLDVEHLELLVDSLLSAEPVPLELDRNVQVLMPELASKRVDLPDEFYRMSIDELRKEVQTRSARTETMMQLRTKAMREKEELRELKKYRYTLIRIRFPDSVLLQGTFNVYEKVRAVKEFVREHVSCEADFRLVNALGGELGESEDDRTLLDLKLVPAVLLTFAWSCEETPASNLKPDTLLLLQQN
ncbi:UBX domain-containing protein [Nesidiocoris tenuis]|uniref:UBX domain-containing protein n=1 Tax=Nesidiocoris tenuis TaxID=355587 RepID=A0ABN7B8S9_9HEMI|nr:UBX domain-containing protein [Nesidiocoris tenuis]